MPTHLNIAWLISHVSCERLGSVDKKYEKREKDGSLA